MATSGSTDFAVTGANVLRDAALLIGAIDGSGDLEPREQQDMLRMLNMMLKSWQIHVELWPTTDVQFTLTPGTESYTVGTGLDINTPRPLRLISCRRENSSGIEVEVDVVTRQEYKMLPQKDTQSPVTLVYYDPQLTNGVLYVWPTGSTNDKILNLTFQRPIEDIDATSNTFDFPQEWYLTIVYNLAVITAPIFDMPVPQSVGSLAIGYLEQLKPWDSSEGSFFIQPDSRGSDGY